MKKFAVVLAGCGQHDGSETHEVICTLLSLDQEGIAWDAFAPNGPQANVINHLTNTKNPHETRSALLEAARLVRGHIRPLPEANVAEYDAVIFPGGMGAVTTLCNWADKQAHFEFNPEVKRFIDDAVQHQKPMGFICIAPMMISKIYPGARFTIGHDKEIANQIEAMGGKHVFCDADQIVVDETHRLVSTPANMVKASIKDIYQGIKKLVQALKAMA